MDILIKIFNDVPEWLKWVLLVFMGGFVAQFGKSLTLKLISLLTKNKEESGNKKEESGYDRKLEKKRLKNQLKLEKKRAKADKKKDK